MNIKALAHQVMNNGHREEKLSMKIMMREQVFDDDMR
jgi:hypothetical protein